MAKDRKQEIRDFLIGLQQIQTYLATVTSVDADQRTCSVEIEEVEYEDVRLYSVADAELKGFVTLPKIGSQVLVSRIGNSNEMFVSMFSVVDGVILTIGEKMELKIKDNEVYLNSDKIVFNGGENHGMVKVKELTDKINKLEKQCNDILTTLQGITIVPNAGLAFKPIFTMAPLVTTQQADIENDKITH